MGRRQGREFSTPARFFLAARRTRWRVGNPTTGGALGGSFPLPPRFSRAAKAAKANPLEGGKPYNGAGALVGSFPLPTRFSSAPGLPGEPVGGWETLQGAGAPGREFSTPVGGQGKPVGGWEPYNGGGRGYSAAFPNTLPFSKRPISRSSSADCSRAACRSWCKSVPKKSTKPAFSSATALSRTGLP